MWYNNKVAHERLARNTSRGSLTIEQQEIKVQAKLVKNLEISLKKKSQIYHGFETYSTKYKEPNKLDKVDFNRKVSIQFAREFDPGSG